MSKFKVEIQITLIAIIIGAAVITSGYFAYKSLSEIVTTIQKDSRPDNRLFLMKDIANELVALENNVRLYTLTNNRSDLKLYDTIQTRIINKIEYLSNLAIPDRKDEILTDSVAVFAAEKLQVWREILNLHLSSKVTTPQFSEIYLKLEEQKTDTIIDQVEVEVERKGLKKLLPKKTTTISDTTYVPRPIEKDSIRQEIQNLETEIAEKDRQANVQESHLIEKNIEITGNINRLIAEAENRESVALIERTNDADNLAELTYKRLALFTIVAVILLLIAISVLFNYLSKSRNYQRVLQKAKAEAENLAKVREQFASNVSHEMRTPVNAIYGLAEQLLQQKTDDQLKEQITVIARSAGHLKNIVNETLDFSKIQSNKLKIDSVHFSPNAVFSEVITLQRNEAEKKGIALNFEVDGEIPDALIGDPVRLKQILINLIGNAIKFTDQGNVTLRVKSIKKKYMMVHLEMMVSDSGIGMPKESLKHIFDEFVQLENQSGKKYSGTGLGLSIVKKLVELQKGYIDVKSEPGLGTEVKTTIPFAEGKKENIKEPGFEEVVIPESFRNYKILIADDEEFNLFLMKAILKKWGIEFQEASNGNEVADMATRDDFDIILMDIRMPGINGIEAAKKILSQKPESNIIAVTATNEYIDREKCLNAGMKGFLLKPFSEKELFEIIRLTLNPGPGNFQKVTKPKVSLEDAKRLANGDEAFLKEMSQLFLESTQKGLSEIKKSLVKKNHDNIAEACHKMAAPCKHFRANDLYATIKQLESQAKNQDDWDSIISQVKLLETEIEEIKKIFDSTLIM